MQVSSLSDRETLALLIIGEARGEGIAGQVAVGCVVRNRLHANPDKYRTFKSVCLESRQFSCFNEGDPNYPYLTELSEKMIDGQVLTDPIIRQCILVSNGIINFDLVDNTKGAEYYLTNQLLSVRTPTWAANKKNVITIGSQTFFSL